MMSTNHTNVTSTTTTTQLQQQQQEPIASCHEAAIALNNFVVTTLLRRDRNYLAAAATFRDVMYLIKRCVIHTTTDDMTGYDNDDDDDAEIAGNTDMNMISTDEIQSILYNGMQRASVPSQQGSLTEPNDGDTPPLFSGVRIQVITNGPNITPSTSTASRPKRTPLATADMSIPTTSTHSTVSTSTSSTVSSVGSTTSTIEVLPLLSSLHMAENIAALQSNANAVHPHTLSVYPMTIDDFTPPTVGEEDSELRLQQVEYHAAIMLYNFGIIHQCIGMMDDATFHREVQLLHPSSTDLNHSNESFTRLLASYTMFSNTMSWIHQLIEPFVTHVMNDEYNDHYEENFTQEPHGMTDGIDTNYGVTTLQVPLDYSSCYHMTRYLQVMILINYHILPIVDEIQLPNECYEYHCTMINEIQNLISYLEVFHPMTDDQFNTSNVLHNINRGASPAA